MDICNFRVRIGGDKLNEAIVANKTAAELTVLRAIHGEDSIAEVEVVGKQNVDHSAERLRLHGVYPRYRELVDKIYSLNGRFPSDVREVGLPAAAIKRADVEVEAEAEPPTDEDEKPDTKGSKKGKAEAVKEGEDGTISFD